MTDLVNNPPHYCQGKIECLDAIEAMSGFEDFCGYLRASIVKYLWRAKSKGKVLEDVRKAQFYMNKLVAALEVATAEVATAEADKAGSALIADLLNQTNEGMPAQKKRK